MKKFGTAVALLALTCLAGCSTTAGIEAVGTTTWNQEGARELQSKVIINNSSLAGDIQVMDAKSALAGDLMRAQVTLKSKDRDTVPIQYRFEWYDANGMEIGAGTSAWKPFLIYGRESRSLQGVAPDPRAREYKLKIREPEE